MQTLFGFLSFVLLTSSSLFSGVQPDARSLLRDAAKHYRDTTAFHLAWETKITSSSPYSSGWSKQMYVVAADGRKYHWEAEGNGLHSLRINDGESDWFYRPSMHQYSVARSDATKPGPPQARGGAGGTTEGWIKSAMQSLLHLDDDANAAEMQSEEVLTIGTVKIPCYVVHARHSMSFRQGVTSTRDNTFWIEKNTGLVRKAILATSGPVAVEDDLDEQTRTVEITYTKLDLGAAPDPALFVFKAPADAYLVEDARQPMARAVSAGSAPPALKLKDKDGRIFDLGELKGKVTLVHFWASWCGACLEEMKTLAQLPKSYADKGLVIVGVDEDELPERGDVYFSSQKYVYRKSWGAAGYPFLVILDRDGKVAWASMGVGKGFLDTLLSQLNKPELGLAP
jgi:thiol-disulfide isomerase/thioredoxin